MWGSPPPQTRAPGRAVPGPRAHLPGSRLWERSLWPIGGASAQPQTGQEPSGPPRDRTFSHGPPWARESEPRPEPRLTLPTTLPAPLRDAPPASAGPSPMATTPAELRRCPGIILHFCIEVCMHTTHTHMHAHMPTHSSVYTPHTQHTRLHTHTPHLHACAHLCWAAQLCKKESLPVCVCVTTCILICIWVSVHTSTGKLEGCERRH